MRHANATAPLLALLAACASTPPVPPATAGVDWPCVGGEPGATRYSTLAQVDRTNVARLGIAWTWTSGGGWANQAIAAPLEAMIPAFDPITAASP